MVNVEPLKFIDWHEPDEPIIEDVDPQELQVPVINAQEMQAMVDQAVAEGYNEGMAKGLGDGRKQGFAEGKTLGHQEGFSQGQKEGFGQGIQDAQQQAAMQLQQELDRLASLYDSLSSARAQLEPEIEQVLVQLSMQLAASLVQAELQQHQHHLLALIEQAIDALPVGVEWLQIVANSQDLEWLQQHYQSHQVQWQLLADDSLSPGSLTLKTKQSLVNVTLEHRWLQQVGLLAEQLDLDAKQVLASVGQPVVELPLEPEPEPEPANSGVEPPPLESGSHDT